MLKPFRWLAALTLLPLSAAAAQTGSVSFDVQKARDVAGNSSGVVWIITADGSPNGGIQRVGPSGPVTQPGAAVRIAVDPNGNAWVVNSGGQLYHWEKVGSAPENWVMSTQRAMDVGVGPTGAVWAVGTDHRIMAFQNGTWKAISGAGDRIAVDPAGNPWVTNANHDIWHWTGTGWTAVPGKAQDVAVGSDGTVFVVGMTPRPGGFQILKQTGNTWTEVSGAAGVAVTVIGTRLSLAQVVPPSNQVVTLNAVPIITQPNTVVVNNVPVINQPTTILLQGTTSIAVSGPSSSASPAAVALPPTPAGEVRRLFFRDQGYEAQMLKAMHYGSWGDREFLNEQYPTASGLSTLERAFAHLGMIAAEDYYSKQPQMMPDQALREIGSETDPNARRAINGILGVLLIAKMQSTVPDPETMALRDWGTQLWRNHKVVAAKTTLDEYLKWKQDPCGYEGKSAGECKTMSELFTTRTPPEALFTARTAEAIFAKGAPELVATAGIITGAVGASVAGAVMASVLGLEVGTTAGGTVITTSLMATFGGAGAQLVGVASAGLFGVFASAGVMVAVVGVSEGYKVVTAMRVEPMLRAKVGVAMTQPIVIENEINSEGSRNFFYLAAVNAAGNRFVIPPTNVDGEIRFYNQGGYVGRMIVSWTLNGKLHADTTASIAVGSEQTVVVPAAAKSITAKTQWSDLGITWKDFWTAPLPAPTYIGYTSYGTVFSPQVKEGYPETENIKGTLNTLTVTHGGGYVARVKVSYMQGGKTVVVYDNVDVTAGWHQEIAIPTDATNIYMEIFSRTGLTGLLGDPLKAVFVKTWPSPPNECVKFYGTTLDPLWNGECK